MDKKRPQGGCLLRCIRILNRPRLGHKPVEPRRETDVPPGTQPLRLVAAGLREALGPKAKDNEEVPPWRRLSQETPDLQEYVCYCSGVGVIRAECLQEDG